MEIADLYVMLRANTHGFTAALGKAAAEAEGFSGRIRHGMVGVAAFGVAGTAALIGVGVAAVKMGSEFQANMTRINSLAMGGKGNMQQLGQSVIDLAGQVGYSPNSLTDALYHIESAFASAHISGRDALNGLRIAAEGAQIGGSNLTDTTRVMTAVIASGITKTGNWKTAMQGMFQTVGAGDMTMDQLNESIGTGILSIGKLYGMTLPDAGAALATFGDGLINGAKAGTELRMAVQDLAMQSKTGIAALEKIGIKSGELGADMRKGGLMSAISDLRDHLIAAKIPANEWGFVMEKAFTKKASAPLALLLGQFDRFKQKMAIMTGQGQTFGAAWEARLRTVQQQADNLKSTFEAWLTELGLKLMPIATKALQDINNGLDWLSKHQTVLRTLGVAAGTVLAVGLGMAAFAAAELAADFLAVALPIAAAAAGIYLLWTHCKQFRQIVRDVGSALKVALGATLNWLAHTALPWLEAAGKKIFGWMQHTALPALKSAWKSTWNAISDVIRAFINGPVAWVKARIKDFQDFWKLHGQAMSELAKRAWNVIKDITQTEITIIITWAKTAWTEFKDAFKIVWDLITGILKVALHFIEDTLAMAWHFILNAIGLFADLLTGRWSKLWGDVKKLVGQGLSDVKKTIGDFASGALNLLFQAGKDIVHGLINGIESVAGSVGSTLKSLASGAVSGFKHMLGIKSPSKVFAEQAKWIPAGIAKGILDNQGMVTDALDKVAALRGSSKGGWAEYWRRHPHHHRGASPAQEAKKAARHAKAEAKKRAEEAAKRTHEYLQRLLDALKAKEHTDVTAREALSKFVTAHRGKHYSWDAVMAAKSRWRGLDKQDATVLAQAIALQTRIDHNRNATAGERHSAASKVAAARKQLAEMKALLVRINAMHAESLRYHKTVTDHIKKVESRHARRLGSRQAMEEDQLTYLAAMSAAGRLGLNTPLHPVRLSTRHPIATDHRRSITPPILVHTHVHIDGREVAQVVQKHTLRHENRNSNNGMSRYTRR